MAPPSTASRELAARIATPGAARERYLPVDTAFAAMLPEAGLVRGRAVGSGGPAAWSLAFALVARAVADGSWMAVVGVPAVGIEAVGELGIPLGRMVVVDVDGGPSVWAERVAAAADGFEVIVTTPPVGAERVARRVRQRLQSNGVVLVAVDIGGPNMGCDVDLTTTRVAWQGLGHGAGHLVARHAMVRVSGRRAPRPVERELLLPGPDGRVCELEPNGVAAGEPVDKTVVRLERAG